MKSIGDKVRRAFLSAAVIFIAVFIAVSLCSLFLLYRRLANINRRSGESLAKFGEEVLNDNITRYADDITTLCGNIIEKNFASCAETAKAVAEYAVNLYAAEEAPVSADSSYGVGFIGGADSEKLREFYLLSQLRTQISSLPEYSPDNLDLFDIFVVTEKGVVIDGTGDYLGEDYGDLRQEDWYIKAKTYKEPLWTDVIVGAVTGVKKIDYIYPIIYEDEFMGVCVASSSLSELYSSFLSVDFQGIRDIILLDSQGKRITGSDEYDTAIVREEGYVVFNDDYCMTAYRVSKNDSLVYFVFDAADIISAVSKTEDEILSSSERIGEYSAKLIGLIFIFYVILGAVLTILAVVFSKKLSNSLVKPIVLLSKKVEAFGKGNMEISVRDIRSDDEVGMLADKFSSMAEGMRKYLSEIKAFTAEQERIKAEMDTAASIQLSLISGELPRGKEFDVSADMRFAREVGGDLYAVFKTDEKHLLLCVADVSGKGIPASLFSVRTKDYIKFYGEMGLKPSEILYNANNRLCDGNEEMLFVTCFLGILDIETGDFEFADAGHNKPVVFGNETAFLECGKPGLPLGCMEGAKYKDLHIRLEKDCGMFIYTDGVTEAVGEDEGFYGDDRLADVLDSLKKGVSAKDVIGGVSKDLKKHYGKRELWDDITMVCVVYIGHEQSGEG